MMNRRNDETAPMKRFLITGLYFIISNGLLIPPETTTHTETDLPGILAVSAFEHYVLDMWHLPFRAILCTY